MKASRTSAGLLLFRRRKSGLEFLLVHPGGPFFKNKDLGAWSIPKGEPASAEEDLLTRAKIEFEEELGIPVSGENFIALGSIRQKGGKIVHGWAVEGDLPDSFKVNSNLFELEWPPRSGRSQKFPEVDKAEFFLEAIAREKIKETQIPFIDRVLEITR